MRIDFRGFLVSVAVLTLAACSSTPSGETCSDAMHSVQGQEKCDHKACDQKTCDGKKCDKKSCDGKHCKKHSDHTHQHGSKCGHKTEKHGNHMDYLHDGHKHAEHGTHYDEHQG